jgi:hypothetical protein
MIKSQSTALMLALTAAVLWTGGCDEPVEIDERAGKISAEALDEDELEIGSIPLATVSGWTRYTSEESPPIGCEQTSMVTAFGCSGSYCDNVRMYCSPTGLSGSGSSWTTYFSEEGNNRRFCGDRQWMVGLACSGRYCDNLAIQCRSFLASSPNGCFWTGWISEEGGGTLYFGQGYYARGMECSGSYCDNKRFWVCRL